MVVSSSSPSSPWKTNPSTPRPARTPAMIPAIRSSATPTAWAAGRLGFASGPRKLNVVATPSSRRVLAECRSAEWKTGAKQKVIPTSLPIRATVPGSRSSRIPSPSRTSAEPQEEEAARLPCLTTGTPAPAATIAAIVEMLTVRERSPPVPTMSTARPSTGHGGSELVHRRDQSLDLRDGLTLGPQRHREPRDLRRRSLPGQDLPHRPAGLFRRQVVPGDQPREHVRPGEVRHRCAAFSRSWRRRPSGRAAGSPCGPARSGREGAAAQRRLATRSPASRRRPVR